VRIDVVRIRKALTESTARRTELDLELDKRLKKQLQSMIVPERGAIDFGDGEDATLPPSGGRNMMRPPSAAMQMQQVPIIAPLAAETLTQPPLALQTAGLARPELFDPAPPEELSPQSKAPLFVVGGLVLAALIGAILYLVRDTTPTVIELPLPELRPVVIARPPEPTPVPAPVAPAPEPVAVQPEPVAVQPEPAAVKPEPATVIVK